MPVVRFSLVKPYSGQQAEVERLFDEFEDWVSQQPGYLVGFRFAASDGSGEVGRLGVWRTLSEADAVAVTEHTMALRSQINMLVEAGHQERIFEVVGRPHNLPE